MLSLAELLVADTEEQVFAVLLAFLQMGGFEVDAWQEGSVPRTMLRAVSRAMAGFSSLLSSIAGGGYLDTARAAWLDLLAWSHYHLERKAAVATRGIVRLTDAGGGPHPFVAEQLLFRSGGLRFRNLADGEVPLNGFVDVEVQAEAPGLKYNVVTGATWELLTSLPTVVVTNPPGLDGTWLTRPGADAESDTSLAERCRARWPASGYLLTTAQVYRAAAITASAEVTRVRVFPHVPSEGTVTVVVAGPSGPVSEAALDAVEDYLDERAPVTVNVEIVNVTMVPVVVTATLYCRAAYAPGALAAAQAALAEFQAALDLGETVYRAALIEVLMGPMGMVNVALAAPAADVTVQPDELASLVASLSVQAV